MNILALNIGNSRAAAAWCVDGHVRCAAAAPSPSAALLRAVCREGGGRGARPDAVGWASVAAPGGTREAAADRALRRVCPGIPRVVVDASAKLGIPVDLAAPDRTGADRFADAVAAVHRFGAPCIACDFGTATTFNLVLPKRGFCGGAIAPGYGMWFRALGAGTARLPGLDPADPPPLRAKTGRDPEQAIRLGACWGFRGMVTEILWQLSKACGKTSPVLVATGGWASLVARHAGFSMAVVPELTLEGIALVARRTLS